MQKHRELNALCVYLCVFPVTIQIDDLYLLHVVHESEIFAPTFLAPAKALMPVELFFQSLYSAIDFHTTPSIP